MSLALLAAGLAAGAMLLVACIRAANRHYHLIYPELHLETSSTVLIVWTTLVTSVTGAAWHLLVLGWTLVLVGSAGWTSGLLPRLLSVLYLVAGTISMFVYLLPEREGDAAALGVMIGIWQAILLWKAGSAEIQAAEINAARLDRA